MAKTITFALFIALLCVNNFAQTGRGTRPRIVEIPNVATPLPTPKIDEAKVIVEPQKPIENEGNNTATPTTVDTGTVIEDDEVLEIKTDLITVPVSVIDNRGKFVSGLQQSDFQIFEDGQQQQIEYFANIESPFTLILLIDVSPSTSFKIDEIQNAAISFTNKMRSNDKVMVVSFDRDTQVLCELTNNRKTLKDAIMGLKFGSGTGLYDAVKFSSNRLKTIEGRKAIVLFTDGVDTQSPLGATYQSSIKDVAEGETIIYSVRYDTYNEMNSKNRSTSNGGLVGAILGGIFGGGSGRSGGGNNGTSKQDYDTGRMYLEDLAEATGGRSLLAGSYINLENAFANIADELRQQYGVGYYPTVEGKVGQKKAVNVRVNRPNLTVRSRTSYIVGETGKPKTQK